MTTQAHSDCGCRSLSDVPHFCAVRVGSATPARDAANRRQTRLSYQALDEGAADPLPHPSFIEVSGADQLFGILRQWDCTLEMKYNKYSIVLAGSGAVDKFVSFRPKQQFLRVEATLPQSEETDSQLEAAGLDLMPYKWGKYRIRLTKADLAKQEPTISALLEQAYDNRGA